MIDSEDEWLAPLTPATDDAAAVCGPPPSVGALDQWQRRLCYVVEVLLPWTTRRADWPAIHSAEVLPMIQALERGFQEFERYIAPHVSDYAAGTVAAAHAETIERCLDELVQLASKVDELLHRKLGIAETQA